MKTLNQFQRSGVQWGSTFWLIALTVFVHLHGDAEFSAESGLVIDGQSIHFSHNTSLFPGNSDEEFRLQPADFAGRELTIFGHETPDGVQAVLIIAEEEVLAHMRELQSKALESDQRNPADASVSVVAERSPE